MPEKVRVKIGDPENRWSGCRVNKAKLPVHLHCSSISSTVKMAVETRL